jgi:hypothetical protein
MAEPVDRGQDPWIDPVTGNPGDEDLRAWIMSMDGTRYEPIVADMNHPATITTGTMSGKAAA